MAYSRYENFAAPEFDYKPSNNIKVQPWQESDVVPPDISTNVPMPEIESMYPFPCCHACAHYLLAPLTR